jgi:hypothetical protein
MPKRHNDLKLSTAVDNMFVSFETKNLFIACELPGGSVENGTRAGCQSPSYGAAGHLGGSADFEIDPGHSQQTGRMPNHCR